MATLTAQFVARSGLDPSYAAAEGGGDEFPNDGKQTFFHIKNGDASPMDVTFETPGLVDGLAVADRTVTVPATGERMVGPFPKAYYGSPAAVTYSSVTTLTVAVIRVP